MRAIGITLLLIGLFSSGCNTQRVNQPQFPHAVGSTTVFVHDPSRPFDAVGGVSTGERTLITEIWYPADNNKLAGVRRATFGDYSFGDKSVHRLMMTQTSFFHLTPDTVREGVSQQQIDNAIDELFQRPRGSYVNAPVAPSKEKFPVVVVSHGDAGSRYNMQSVSEYLASHGYIVIAPEHTGNSPYSFIGKDPAAQKNSDAHSAVNSLLDERGVYAVEKLLGQTYIPFGPQEQSVTPEALQRLDAALVERVNDLRAVLQHLEKMNKTGFLAGRIDLQNVGLMGRSFGGATTLVGLALEERFKAGMAVVPAVGMPDFRSLMPPEVLVSSPRESAFLHAENTSGFRQLYKPTLIMSDAEDSVIIGLEKSLLPMSGQAEPTPVEPFPAVRQLLQNSNVPVIYALLQNTNHASLAYAGPYWWPHLKPNTFSRVLNASESYRLMEPGRAHTIAQDKALQFFDAYLKEDQLAREALGNNPYGEENLRLTRNPL